MKKHRPCRLMDTGIRIPQHRIKRMAPLQEDVSRSLDILPSTSKKFANLFINNFNLFTQCEDSVESDEVIDVLDWEEVKCDD